MWHKLIAARGALPSKEMIFLGLAILIVIVPELALADVESSLNGFQHKLTHVVLPVLSVIGFLWSGMSFITGHENAKKHIMYAAFGSAIGYAAQAIVEFISSTVH